MAIYKSFDQLNGKTVRYGDEVHIAGIKYGTRDCFFYTIGGLANSVIFEALSIPERKMYRLLNKVYGYVDLGGDWPQSKRDDYGALTRAMLVLLAFAEGEKEISVEMPDGKWITFLSEDYRKSNCTKVYMQAGERTVRVTKDYVVVGFDKEAISFEMVGNLLSKMSRALRRTSIILTPAYTSSYTRSTLKIGCQQIPKQQIQDIYDCMVRLRGEKLAAK